MSWYKNRYLKKMFLETTEWNVAWKNKNDNYYRLMMNPNGFWLADTLLFNDENSTFLFVEAFEKKENLGRLAVFEFNGQDFSDFRIIMKKNYHLSYPFVFKHEKEYYMIPETSENNSIELYRATKFPDEWKYICKLKEGKYVDTTVYKINKTDYRLFTYDMVSHSMLSGVLCMEDFTINIEKIFPDSKYMLRAGGNVFEEKNKILRSVQNNQYFYGQSLSVVEYKTGNKVKEILPKEIITDKKNVFRRVHTYSNVGEFEAVDLSDYKVNPIKPIKKIIEKVNKNGEEK